MKKKILTFILLTCMIVPCMVSQTACFDDSGSGSDEFSGAEILQSEWEKSITPDEFEIRGDVYVNHELEGEEYRDELRKLYKQLKFLTLSYTKDSYSIVYKDTERDDNNDVNCDFTKRTVGETTEYIKTEHRVSRYWYGHLKYNEYNGFKTVESKIDKATYDGNVENYVALINYVKNNYGKFTYVEEQSERRGLYSVYKPNAEVLAESSVKELGITSLEVERDSGVSITFSCDNKDNLSYRIEFGKKNLFAKAISNLENYTVKGGPSETDIDYAEYTFNKNGFRLYTPNNTDETRKEAFFMVDNDTQNYIYFSKNSAGEWQQTESSKETYENTVNTTRNLYIPYNFEPSYEGSYDSSYGLTKDGYKPRGWRTGTINENTQISYKDIVFTADENGNITGGSWKFTITQGDVKSAEYKIQLIVNDEEIVYPITSYTHEEHSYQNNWSYNDDFHWHACGKGNCISVSDKAPHDFDEGVVTVEAETYKDGSKTYTCKTCGKKVVKTYEYEYPVEPAAEPLKSEEEWNDSISVYSVKEGRIRVSYSTLTADKKDDLRDSWGNADSLFSYWFDANGSVNSGFGETEWYVAKEGDNYVKYVRHETHLSKFRKLSITKEEYEEALNKKSLDFAEIFKYDDFKNNFNAFEGRYELDSYTFNGETVTDLEIYFENGKVSKIYFTKGENVYRFDIYRSDALITLPSESDILD